MINKTSNTVTSVNDCLHYLKILSLEIGRLRATVPFQKFIRSKREVERFSYCGNNTLFF